MTELTADLLRQIMNCPADRAAECFPAMIEGMRQFRIDTPPRITCFLTQVKWESGGLVYFAELASGDAYNGRADLGNTQPGDGPRYKGSGPIQVTGRSNFQSAQQALNAAGIGIDIVANPDLARTVKYGFWISCWWWEAHGGNEVAEQAPLSWATVRCGRLVNRGNADSQYQAQDEAERLAAFAHVQQFGTLALPGSTPIIPPAPPAPPVTPKDGFDMADLNDLHAVVKAELAAAGLARASQVPSAKDVAAAVAALPVVARIDKATSALVDWVCGPVVNGKRDEANGVGFRVASIKSTLAGLAGAVKASVHK